MVIKQSRKLKIKIFLRELKINLFKFYKKVNYLRELKILKHKKCYQKFIYHLEVQSILTLNIII